MTKKASHHLSPHERVEQILETIALLQEDQQAVVLAEAFDLLESSANTQPLPYRLQDIECLATFAAPGSKIEKRLQGLWEAGNINYARLGKTEKKAIQISMNEWIREPNSQWAEPAARVYCIVTLGHPADLWKRMKSFGRRTAPGSDPQPTQ